MSKIVMYVLITALTSSLGLLGKVGCDKYKLQSANDQLNEQLMQADLELGRALTKFDDAESYVDQLKDEIQDEIESRNAAVSMYGELKFRYKVLQKRKRGKHVKTVYRDKIIEIPADVKLGLSPGMLYVALSENSMKALVSVQGSFDDYRLHVDARMIPYPDRLDWEFNYKLQLNVKVQLAETHTPSGAINHYATVTELDDKGNAVRELEITNFSVVVNKPGEKQWFWWAPHVDIGALVGAKFVPPDMMLGGSLGLTPFAYGLTVNDLDWRFLRVSMDLTNSLPGFGITPVVWNLGGPLPLLSNLWIGPHVSYLPPEDWALSLFVGAVL